MNEELNREFESTIELPVKTMKKAASKEVRNLIFGGIAFHEFWEGSSRYTMRYYIYYLPFGAYGLKVLLGFIREHVKRKI